MQTQSFIRGICVTGIAGIIGASCLIPRVVLAANPDQAAKLSFTESFRKETMTTHSMNGFSSFTETKSASGGKLTLHAEVPLNNELKPFDADTPFNIHFGNYDFHAKLGSDSQFQTGKTSVTLKQFAAVSSGSTHILLATAQLKWDHNRLSVKIEAKVPESSKPAVAEDLTSGKPGDIEGETECRIEIADQISEFKAPFQGRLQRKSANTPDVEGEVDIVSVHGEVKSEK